MIDTSPRRPPNPFATFSTTDLVENNWASRQVGRQADQHHGQVEDFFNFSQWPDSVTGTAVWSQTEPLE